eukprot:TRINITY_DN4550_c0_g1_i10.p1 TRINITY_DN4550_c0_g1~~TRINITY_DN4550_c0_g1_i10.p1  ORF type:complete len:749 (+),score=202.58 TRINITY_DN4550_c0_g1_i10:68-2248(+)
MCIRDSIYTKQTNTSNKVKAREQQGNMSTNPHHKDQERPKKFNITVHDRLKGESLQIGVYPWATVTVIKNQLEKVCGIPKHKQRLYCGNVELKKNNSSLNSYGINKHSQLYLHTDSELLNDDVKYIKPYEHLTISQELNHTLHEIRQGIAVDLLPKLTLEGTSGTYFLRNGERKTAAIFKPIDEEAYAPNNPRGYTGAFGSEGFRKGIRSGESGIREVAAFLLDLKGFFSVPHTTLVEFVHPAFFKGMKAGGYDEEEEQSIAIETMMMAAPNNSFLKNVDRKIKHGSLQCFVKHDDVAGNFGYSAFPTDQVHKIAILDIRILNCDRNEENILVRRHKGKDGKHWNELIPIDHGLSLPDCFDVCDYEIVWMSWPQAKEPFSKEELDIINSINPKKDAELLEKYLSIREVCLRNFRIANIILKKGANKGLTLYDIGRILYKEDPDDPSKIEKIVQKTEDYIHFVSLNSKNHLDAVSLSKESSKSSNGSAEKKLSPRETGGISLTVIKEESRKSISEGTEDGDGSRKSLEKRSSSHKTINFTSHITDRPMHDGAEPDGHHYQHQHHIQHHHHVSEHLSDGTKSTNSSNHTSDEKAPLEESKKNKEEDEEEVEESQKKEKKKGGLTRTSSLPEIAGLDTLRRSESENQAEAEDAAKRDSPNMLKKTISEHRMQKNLRPKGVKSSKRYDETFYYYFEIFVEELLGEKLIEGIKIQQSRGRAYSIDDRKIQK